MTEKEFCRLWENGPLFAQADNHRLGTDSVLLADFVKPAKYKKGIDLGCASGILGLLLMTVNPSLRVTGLELNPEAADLARLNLEANSLGERGAVITGDIRRVRELFPSGAFPLVVSNPPYFTAGSGKLSPDPARASARSETDCSFEDICAAAEYLCPTGGSFNLVHRPERLSEIFCVMTAHGLEPKRLRAVCPRASSAPSLVLVEGRRGGKPGLIIEPPLVLQNSDGSETDEVRKIYHR